MALTKVTITGATTFSGRVAPRILKATEITKLNEAQDEIIANGLIAAVAVLNRNLLEDDGTVKACLVNGLTIIDGGSGIADMTLAAPTLGARCVIRIGAISSGTVVVTTESGVTVDGANNTMTFDAAEEAIELIYKSATEWAIVRNEGAVALSAV